MTDLLTMKEAGLRLGVSHDTVNRLVKAGELRVVDVSAGNVRPRLRIRTDDLEEFIEARTHEAPSPDDGGELLDAASS